jgi:3'-phosphoadenosine 5'-phosphosulfate sulfotransferase (PAPS reductase)/FAD synthetase
MIDQNTFELPLKLELPPLRRLLIWWSAGATSTVAANLALNRIKGLETRIFYCETGSHHPDNLRFLRDCENWIGHKIEIVQNQKYASVDDLIEKERFLNGPDGAKCTQQLKIAVRKSIQRPGSDLQVFGFHAGEVDRAMEYRQNWPEVRLMCPLIDDGLFHDDCLALLRRAGIELPLLYRQGFKNNNCIACVKGGKGYFNKIRVLYPQAFAKRAKQEREIGRSCINGTFLDELDPEAGRYESEPDIACEGLCVKAAKELENCDK